MRVIVDADACPVKNIIKEIALKYKTEVIMVCDTSHEISDDYCTVVTVDKHSDSADIYIINNAKDGDVVVTSDFGVAALALGKGVKCIGNNGICYTNDNIDRLLFERFLGKKVRMGGGKTKGPKKRTAEDDFIFRNEFEKILSKGVDK